MPRTGVGGATLGLASGAAGGLEDLVIRQMQERQQAERERAAVVAERHAASQLEEQKHYREMELQQRQLEAAERAGDREEGRRLQRINTFMLQPMGNYNAASAVEPLIKENPELAPFFDYQAETNTEGKDAQGNLTTTTRAPGYRFLGKQADLQKAETESRTAADRDADRQMKILTAAMMANARQANGPLVQVQDPDSGQTIWTPRSEAAGAQGPRSAGTRDRIDAYRTTLDLIDDIEALGDSIQWRGLGGLGVGSVKRGLNRALGTGDPKEEMLRNMLDRLRAQASFQEGGKQFTGTEAALLDNFLSSVNSSPQAARTRLRSFKKSSQQSLQGLGVNWQSKRVRDQGQPQGTGRSSGAGPGPGGPIRIISVEEVR